MKENWINVSNASWFLAKIPEVIDSLTSSGIGFLLDDCDEYWEKHIVLYMYRNILLKWKNVTRKLKNWASEVHEIYNLFWV